MIVRALVFVALLALGSIAPGGVQAAEPVFPAGSRIGLVPPTGFDVSQRISGFESPLPGSIILTELPAEAFDQLSERLTSEALKAQGIAETARRDVTIGSANGVLIDSEQTVGQARLRKWILLLREPSMTGFVLAQTLAGRDAEAERAIAASLETIAFRAPLSMDDQLAALPFRIGDRSGFRPVRVLAGNSLMMTDGPEDTVKEAAQPLVVIAQSTGPGPQAEQRDSFARTALLANASITELVVERSESFRQAGSDWHELVARAKEATSGKPIVVMQTIRFAGGRYVRMIGVAKAEERDVMLPRFRRVFDSVEPE